MVIAVTYDKETGNVGEHFGHAEWFKLYEVDEDGKLMDSAVVKPIGSGHAAMVASLLDYSTSVLICGGVGDSAKNGLNDNQIAVCAGITGSADEAVEKLIRGELTFTHEANCNCHEDGHSCCGEGGSCGAPGSCCH